MKRRANSKESGIIAVDLASDDVALFVAGTFVDPFPGSTQTGTCTLISIMKIENLSALNGWE